MTFTSLVLLWLLVSFLHADAWQDCRAYPGSCDWPSPAEWQALNESIGNRLLRPLPPAAPCHLSEPDYNNSSCAYITSQWSNSVFHADNPISTDNNNWNNDSCLPSPLAPCSGEGYPVYVVNATCVEDVQKGVDFAREHNVRLVVKGTGHDYLGRSVAPYSLSIWTHNMRGLSFHESPFQPQLCAAKYDTAAITMSAGHGFGDVYPFAAQYNTTVVGPLVGTIGPGGYLTGGGHSPLSAALGLAVDQVLEMQVVTADGRLIIANECQNSDIFWAMCGGGGATFGVITSITIKAIPSPSMASITAIWIAEGNSSAYWGANAYLTSNYKSLIESGVYGYVFTGGSIFLDTIGAGPPGSTAGLYEGVFVAPNMTLTDLESHLLPLLEHMNATWPNQITLLPTASHFDRDFYSWWLSMNATANAPGIGIDLINGNRLLDGNALSQPQSVLEEILKEATPPHQSININLISGPGVWNAQPAGGGNSINPAWRTAYAEFVTSVAWTPRNFVQEFSNITALLSQYVPAIEKLAGPDSGCYVNEDNPYDTRWPDSFWSSNYPRLLSIKRKVDPWDVFWCSSCVGKEGWEELNDGRLCRT